MFSFRRNMEDNKTLLIIHPDDFFPPVYMGYTYSVITQPEDFLCTWKIKLPRQGFVLKQEL